MSVGTYKIWKPKINCWYEASLLIVDFSKAFISILWLMMKYHRHFHMPQFFFKSLATLRYVSFFSPSFVSIVSGACCLFSFALFHVLFESLYRNINAVSNAAKHASSFFFSIHIVCQCHLMHVHYLLLLLLLLLLFFFFFFFLFLLLLLLLLLLLFTH